MATSQNGWPAYNTTEYFVRGDAEGFDFWAADDDVAYIFADLVSHLAPILGGLDLKSCWSWADRNVRDSDTVVSNHASATAIDLNALAYPRGTRNMTGAQESAVRALLKARYRNLVRWGGDYVSALPDQMHYEILTNRAGATSLVADLRRSNVALTKADAELIVETFLEHQVELTPAAAQAMSTATTPRKAGDNVSLSYILQWGGAGLYRVYGIVKGRPSS